nr:hypothetical protein Iba_chr09eCG11060 [Ipomoea batatas]
MGRIYVIACITLHSSFWDGFSTTRFLGKQLCLCVFAVLSFPVGHGCFCIPLLKLCPQDLVSIICWFCHICCWCSNPGFLGVCIR